MLGILLIIIIFLLWGIYRSQVPSLKDRIKQTNRDLEITKMQHPELFKDDNKKRSIWEKNIGELFRRNKRRRNVRRDEKGRFIKS